MRILLDECAPRPLRQKFSNYDKGAGVAVIVLVAPSNKLSDLLPLIPDVFNILNTIAAGEVIEIGSS